MSLKKKAVSLLLTGTLVATLLAPTALAGDYEGYQSLYLNFPNAVQGYELVRKTEYYYDDEEGQFKSENVCIYENDNQGRVIKQTDYYNKDLQKIYRTDVYNYDNSTGRLLTISSAEGDHDYIPLTLTYDQNGDVVKTVSEFDDEFSDDKYSTVDEYTYDNHHNVTEAKFSSFINGSIVNYIDVFSYSNVYDDSGKLISKKEVYSTIPESTNFQAPDIIETFEYDNNGRLTKKNVSGEEGGTYTYEYDTAGNLAKENVFYEGELISYTTYEYQRIGADVPHVGQFFDVPLSQYYADAVKWAVDEGITNGTSDTAFSPDNSCTRGQIMQMLWRASGSPEPTTSNNPFTDVKESDYYYKAVLWAVEKGITSGTTETTFSPNTTCTRAQAVTFLWISEGKYASLNINSFTDINSNDYYYDAVKWATQMGITSGTSATTFSPTQNCTRAQIVTFIYKAMN